MSAFIPNFDYIILISGLWGTELHFCQISLEDYIQKMHSGELILYNEDLICPNNGMHFIERAQHYKNNTKGTYFMRAEHE